MFLDIYITIFNLSITLKLDLRSHLSLNYRRILILHFKSLIKVFLLSHFSG